MWWQFKSAFVRKIAYLLAAFLFALVLGHRAHAACQRFVWNDSGSGDYTVASAFAAYADSVFAPAPNGSGGYIYANYVCVPGGAPTAAGQVTDCQAQSNFPGLSLSSVSRPCDGQCTSSQPMDIFSAIAGNTGTSVGLMCVAGCGYTNSANALQIGGARASVQSQAVPTGAACNSATDGSQAGQAGSCFQADGITACSVPLAASSGSAPVASEANINGDEIAPPTVPPTAPKLPPCTAFADGAVACVKPATGNPVGAPTDSSGAPDVPAAVVSDSTGAVNYYSSAQVAASHTPVVSAAGGVSKVATGTGTASGTGSITAGGSGAGVTGDCPPGQTCSGVTDSTGGGLDCATPPTCVDTDPVLCGVQNQVWLLRCENPTESQLATGVGAVGTIPIVAAGDFSTMTSESGAFVTAGGSCPAPVTISVMGRPLVLNWWSTLCSFASAISSVVMLLAYVVAARIVYVAITGGSQTSGG